jgi:hypothetical protein
MCWQGHNLSSTQVSAFIHDFVVRNVYEFIAEHKQIFKHHYSDSRIASTLDLHIA